MKRRTFLQAILAIPAIECLLDAVSTTSTGVNPVDPRDAFFNWDVDYPMVPPVKTEYRGY